MLEKRELKPWAVTLGSFFFKAAGFPGRGGRRRGGSKMCISSGPLLIWNLLPFLGRLKAHPFWELPFKERHLHK